VGKCSLVFVKNIVAGMAQSIKGDFLYKVATSEFCAAMERASVTLTIVNCTMGAVELQPAPVTVTKLSQKAAGLWLSPSSDRSMAFLLDLSEELYSTVPLWCVPPSGA
jgi:hypothetical protein